MNCTKLLHIPSGYSLPPPVMPLNMAMQVCFADSHHLRHLLGAPAFQSAKAPRTLYHSLQKQPTFTSLDWGEAKTSTLGSSAKKKRVVFADAKGLALTEVRFFSEEAESPSPCPSPPAAETSPGVSRLPGAGSTSQAGGRTTESRAPARSRQQLQLRLGFPQPKADIRAFHARLQEVLVLLESCSVTPHALSGTICVRNMGFDKTVHVRITFDSWQTHREVPCTLLHQRLKAVKDAEVFAFNIPLPEKLDPKELVEFCICCRSNNQKAPVFDNNKGQNYRIQLSTEIETPIASILTSQRSLSLPAKRKGFLVSLPRGAGNRLDYATNSLLLHSLQPAGVDR
ncbi:hypothetical protein AGOR_G00007940 [Albula goreensis]|uniref:CBM21 domain-containing protein n=1 Tax=Albula goreensis TaxID=1534307 RepID=A0A8T3E9R1_9TELE|nr:hypothetical protein AGOR_G00007940 [Albula goreensis]